METKKPTVESIMRQQKIRRIIFRIIMIIILIIICIFIGRFIGTIGQKESQPYSHSISSERITLHINDHIL